MSLYGKSFTPAQLSRIVKAEQSKNPLFLRTLLEEMRYYQDNPNSMSLRSPHIPTECSACMNSWIRSSATTSPPALLRNSSILCSHVSKTTSRSRTQVALLAEHRYCPSSTLTKFSGGRSLQGMVGDILSLVWVSRRGLTETELLDILAIPHSLWSPLHLALVRSLLRSSSVTAVA